MELGETWFLLFFLLMVYLISPSVDNAPLSSELRAARAVSDVGIEAVPAGTYQETSPYILLQTQADPVLPVESQLEIISYLDWSKSGLQSQDLLKVKLVEVANFNILYLHPDDSSCPYLGWS